MPDYVKKPAIRSADWNYGGSKWKLSRSKIDLFLECRLCFYLDNKLGVARPRGPSFTLNIAVDELLKKEFDIHRAIKSAHPLMQSYGIDAIPYAHSDLAVWRENFKGIVYEDPDSGLTVSGAIDDVWVNPKGELIVVDYKATSKEGKIETMADSGWVDQYKRQMEVYQWLLRRKGFPVSRTGYFVYVNGKKDRKSFDGRLEFDVTILPQAGDDSWLPATLLEVKKCLDSSVLPAHNPECEFCMYRKHARDVQQAAAKK